MGRPQNPNYRQGRRPDRYAPDGKLIPGDDGPWWWDAPDPALPWYDESAALPRDGNRPDSETDTGDGTGQTDNGMPAYYGAQGAAGAGDRDSDTGPWTAPSPTSVEEEPPSDWYAFWDEYNGEGLFGPGANNCSFLQAYANPVAWCVRDWGNPVSYGQVIPFGVWLSEDCVVLNATCGRLYDGSAVIPDPPLWAGEDAVREWAEAVADYGVYSAETAASGGTPMTFWEWVASTLPMVGPYPACLPRPKCNIARWDEVCSDSPCLPNQVCYRASYYDHDVCGTDCVVWGQCEALNPLIVD